MSGANLLLTCAEVRRILSRFGFSFRSQEGAEPFREVTVDCPLAPLSGWLLQAMIKQAGMGKRRNGYRGAEGV